MIDYSLKETIEYTDKCYNFAESKIVNVMEKFLKVLMMLAVCISPSVAISQTPASASSIVEERQDIIPKSSNISESKIPYIIM